MPGHLQQRGQLKRQTLGDCNGSETLSKSRVHCRIGAARLLLQIFPGFFIFHAIEKEPNYLQYFRLPHERNPDMKNAMLSSASFSGWMLVENRWKCGKVGGIGRKKRVPQQWLRFICDNKTHHRAETTTTTTLEEWAVAGGAVSWG